MFLLQIVLLSFHYLSTRDPIDKITVANHPIVEIIFFNSLITLKIALNSVICAEEMLREITAGCVKHCSGLISSFRCRKISRYRGKWRPVYILRDVHCKRIAIFGLAAHSTRAILKIVLTEKSSWPENTDYKCVYTAGLYRVILFLKK